MIQHLKEAVTANAPALRRELGLLVSQFETRQAPPLDAFIEHAGVELEDVAKVGWAALKRSVDLVPHAAGPHEATLQRGIRRLLHMDDTERIDRLLRWLDQPDPPQLSTEYDRRVAWMFLVTLWGLRGAPDTAAAAWQGLWEAPSIRHELLEVLPLLRERIARPSLPLPDDDVPLRLHATYARDEVLAAFGGLVPGKRYGHQAGPWWHEPAQTDVLFITLQKTEKEYSPTTLYRDYAISRNLFHWESQNSTKRSSTMGQRYLNQRTNGVRILLAVRTTQRDPWGATRPYTILGPADYVQHQGEQPIAITWRLHNLIPADLYEEYKVAAA